LRTLEARLGAPLATETRRQLLWCHYVDAVYLAHHGETALALAALAQGLRLVPAERELLRLRELLRQRPAQFSLRDFVQTP
jgi:hypothetical protein